MWSKGRPLPAIPKSQRDTENERKIVVKQLPRNVSSDTLELFFESKKHFGREMIVEDVHIDLEHDKAVVKFQKSEDVHHVLQKHATSPCCLHNQTLVVEAFLQEEADTVDIGEARMYSQNYSDMYNYSIGYDDSTNTVEVRGFSESCRNDTIEYYFENTKRSGGGEIVAFNMNRDQGYIRITFKDKSVVKQVVEKKHAVEGRDLIVRPFIICKTKLLLEKVPETIMEEHLANFLEAKLKVTAIGIVFSQDRSKVMVQFNNPFDFGMAKDVCGKYKVGGEYVIPIQVPVSNGIVVMEIPEDVTNDAVEVYFENTRRSRGGDTVNVDLHKDDGYCLVFFEDPKVVSHVCQKHDHTLHGQRVDVQPYYECLGLPAGCEGLALKLPEPISLQNYDSYKMKFLKSVSSQQSTLEHELAKCHADILWDDEPISIECTLTKDDKSHRQILKTWNANVHAVITQFADILIVKKKVVDIAIWAEIRTELGELQLSHPDGVALIMEKDNKQIILVAHMGLADSVWDNIIEAIQTADKKDREKREAVTEEKQLHEWKINYLKAASFRDEMLAEYSNTKIDFVDKKGNGKLVIKGPKQAVHSIWISMFERLQNVRRRDVELDKENLQLLQNEKIRDKIRKKMKEQCVSDVWEIKTDVVLLYADDEEDVSKMETAINETLAKLCITLDSGTENILKSNKWKAIEKSLKDKFSGCVVFTAKTGQLEIFTIADIQDHVSDEIQGILSKNAVYKEQMSLSPHVVLFLQRVMRKQYERDIQALRDRGVNINLTLDDKNGSICIEGTSDGIKEGKMLIQKLKESIQIEQHTVQYRKIKTYLACIKGQECIKNVEHDIPCVIDMAGSGFKKSLHGSQQQIMGTFDKPTHCAEATLKHGVTVTVIGGDMTVLDAEVLVNAANRELKHVGGLAAVIVNKGGKDIQCECDDRVRQKGALSEGNVFMSKGGKLQCKGVAHAVGPHWKGGGDGEEMCLQKAVYSCLEKTEKRNWKSIAIPALSAGMFHYPVDMSCMAIVKAVDQHFKSNKSSIKDVFLCDINRTTVHAFTVALQKVVSNVKVHVDLSQADGPHPAWLINTDDDRASRNDRIGASGNVSIEVVKAELAKEKVDVIVNSASPDLQLKKGISSSAILKAAGDKVQKDCDQNYSSGIDIGEVAVTTAGKLKCKNIFHIALNHYDRDNHRGCIQGIMNSVSACLKEANKRNYKSIAFPAMGTGAQRYPKDKVVKEMFKTVSAFFKNNSSSSVQRVRFVIYTEDDATYEAFITEEKNWTGASGGATHHRSSSGGGKNTIPGFGKLIKESRGLAEFKFGNLNVHLYDGDITEESTDAIVASCNLELDLTKGAVTKALLKKGGDAIEQDCKQQKSTMRKEGIAITTAGQLRSKYVIHVDTKHKTWDWKPVIVNCLKMAEKHKLSSVAFPALGTSVGCKPEDIAKVIYSAIAEFQKDNPRHLQEIRLVIFKKDMVSHFITGMKASVQGRPGSRDNHSGDGNSGNRQRCPVRQSQNYGQQHQQTQDDSADSCTITVYAETKDKVQRAVKSFEKTVENEWHIKKIEDQSIHRLSANNIKELKNMARNYHVEVNIDTDLGKIEVVGLIVNVMDAFDTIHNQLRSADQSMFMKGQAQLMSSMVRWIYLKNQKECPFPDRTNFDIENAYKKKDKNFKIKDRSGSECEIDFGNMTGHDIKQPKDKYPVIRRDLITGASLDIPKTWQAMKDKVNLTLVPLNPNNQEYTDVLSEFQKTLGRVPTINKIERIQNKTLYTQYSAKRKGMDTAYSQKGNETVLWHGTAETAVASINSHGFNRSYCGIHGTAIGEGVYFAVPSSYSDSTTYSPAGSDGNKRMYRCLVLTGKYTQGSGGLRVPPPIDPSIPHILYDSVTNNTSNPLMFVVFNDTQAYPEHIITYK